MKSRFTFWQHFFLNFICCNWVHYPTRKKINRIFSTSHHHTFMSICVEKKITLRDRPGLTFSLLEIEFCLPLLSITSSSLFWSLPGEIQAVITNFAGPLLHNTHPVVDLDCSFALGQAWSAVELLSRSLLSLLRGRGQGHILHPLSVPAAGSSAWRKEKERAQLFHAQACGRGQQHCGHPSESLAHTDPSGTI